MKKLYLTLFAALATIHTALAHSDRAYINDPGIAFPASLMTPGQVFEFKPHQKRDRYSSPNPEYTRRIVDAALQQSIHALIALMDESLGKLAAPGNIKVYYMGDVCFREGVTTRLLQVKVLDTDDQFRMVLGLNIVEGQVKSVITFAEYSRVIGFGGLRYTGYKGSTFRIYDHMFSCNIIPWAREVPDECRRFKMERDGLLYACRQRKRDRVPKRYHFMNYRITSGLAR